MERAKNGRIGYGVSCKAQGEVLGILGVSLQATF